MNRQEVEAKENEWRKAVNTMFHEGVISGRQQKSLHQKISVWCYDQIHGANNTKYGTEVKEVKQ